MPVLELMKQVFGVFSLSCCLSLLEISLVKSLILRHIEVGTSNVGR